MTLFKTMDEKRQWRLGCEAMGQRFVQEWQRLRFTPQTVHGADAWIDLPCVLRNPHMAALLHAHWFALAARHGMDVAYVFHEIAAPSNPPPASRPYETPQENKPLVAWRQRLGREIGQRLLEEAGKAGLDLAPIEYLCSAPLSQKEINLTHMRADFLLTLAQRGLSVQYILTGFYPAADGQNSSMEAQT